MVPFNSIFVGLNCNSYVCVSICDKVNIFIFVPEEHVAATKYLELWLSELTIQGYQLLPLGKNKEKQIFHMLGLSNSQFNHNYEVVMVYY